MRNVIDEPTIDSREPWKGDVLNRQESAIGLTRLLSTIDHAMVLCVSSPFGSGKSFFAKRWHADLERQEKIAVYIDAWQSEFSGDPVVAIVTAIKSVLVHKSTPDKFERIKKAVDGLVEHGPSVLLRASTKIATRLATFGLVDGDIDRISEVITAAVIDEAEQQVSRRIESFEQQTKAREEFRSQLSRLREIAISFGTQKKGTRKDRNIYVLVDELDRCNPRYAIQFLEATHHLFNVAGFVFVLLVDERQLNSVSEVLYGARTTGEPYIKKFVDWTITLPAPPIPNYIDFLFNSYRLEDVIPSDTQLVWQNRSSYVAPPAIFAHEARTSLRTLNQIYGHLNVLVRMRMEPPIGQLLTVLLFVRHQHPQAWKTFSDGSMLEPSVIRDLFLGKRNPLSQGEGYLEAWLIFDILFASVTPGYSEEKLIVRIAEGKKSLERIVGAQDVNSRLSQYVSWIEHAS